MHELAGTINSADEQAFSTQQKSTLSAKEGCFIYKLL